MKNFKKLFTLLLVCVLILPTFLFSACLDICCEKRYDVAIKLTDNNKNVYIFNTDIDELKTEYEFSGERIYFNVQYSYIDRPTYEDIWLQDTHIKVSYWRKIEGAEGGETPKEIKEKGTYQVSVTVGGGTTIKERNVKLIITIV